VQSLFPTTPSALSDDDLEELYAYPSEGRWLRANFVSSLDGAAQGPDDKSGSLSGRADQKVFAMLRSLCDLVLVGAGTARVEGYQPVQAHETNQQRRARLGLAPLPSIAVVSRSLNIDPSLVSGGDAPTLVITSAASSPEARADVGKVAPVIVAGDQEIDLRAAIDELAGLGYQRMLCEGGPSLMRDLVAVDAVDELCWTIEPLLVGGDRKRILDGAPVGPAQGMRLRHLLESDGVLFARYTKGSD
jgi:riboflavin biosynthesis pyrimidine reductase